MPARSSAPGALHAANIPRNSLLKGTSPLGDTTDEWKDRSRQERAHPHPAEEVDEVLIRPRRDLVWARRC
jgi:hypothetical protein